MASIVLKYLAQYNRGIPALNKPESITIRVSTEFKALLLKQAKAQNRSITSYLEWLVMQDAARTEPKNRRG